MTNLLVFVANNEGKLIYMNNRLYSLLQVQSEEVIGKEIGSHIGHPDLPVRCLPIGHQTPLQMENLEILIDAKQPQEENEKDKQPTFQGYATVTPIRGKESSLDYYLMILSKNPLT